MDTNYSVGRISWAARALVFYYVIIVYKLHGQQQATGQTVVCCEVLAYIRRLVGGVTQKNCPLNIVIAT